MNTVIFQCSGNLTNFSLHPTTEGGLVKRALVAVEGEFKDSKGRSHIFTSEKLNKIVEFTNRALQKGQTIPVCLDHNKTVENTVGSLDPESSFAYTKIVTEEDLPNPKATHLLGKLGLFVDHVVIKSKNAIEKVLEGVTGVSMGLNLDPADFRIVELSLVPIPAIPNMGLFALDNNVANAYTWEDLETNTSALEDLEDQYKDLTDKLWTLIKNIYNDEELDIPDLDTLKSYVYNALNGFSLRMIELLGLVYEDEPVQDPLMNQTQAEPGNLENSPIGMQAQPYAYTFPDNYVARFSRGSRYIRGLKYTRII